MKASKSSTASRVSSRSQSLRAVVVALDAEAVREVGEDVDIVAAALHRRDRLAHEDRVVAGAGPRRVDVVALPEGGRGQHDVGIARGGRQEMVLRDDELDAVERVR